MGALERGLSAGFGAAADMVKTQHAANLQQRHSLALEKVRHQYRGEEREQAGIISGKQAEAKSKAMSAEKGIEREHQKGLQTQKDEAAKEREYIKGGASMAREKLKAANKPKKWVGFDGHEYTTQDVFDNYAILYPMAQYGVTGDGSFVSVEDFAKNRMGINNFLRGEAEAGQAPGGPEGPEAPAKPGEKAGPATTPDQRSKITQGNARGYYLNLKRRFPDDSENEINDEVRKRYPSWKG